MRMTNTHASHYQLGLLIDQEGKPIFFYWCKLTDTHNRYMATEKYKAQMSFSLPYYVKNKVYTDHLKITYKIFNTNRV